LVAESAVYPAVLGSTFSRAFLCSSLFPLGKFVEDAVDPKGLLGAGGSVATTAWDFARLLGASSVWAAGLDLSFPDLKTHFKGALFEERTHAESTRTQPGELWSFKALRDGLPFSAADASGGSVLTDRRLSLYAAWFENRFRRFPGAAPLSLSRRGLRIGGMETRSIEELLALPDRRAEIDRRLGEAFAGEDRRFLAPAERGRREAAFSRRLEELEAALEALAEISRNAAAEAEAGLGAGIDGRTLEALERAEAAVGSSSVKEIAGFLFPPVAELEAVLERDPEDPLRRHVRFALLLYRRIAENAERTLGLLKKTVKPDRAEPIFKL
jgi:hypothetical protein